MRFNILGQLPRPWENIGDPGSSSGSVEYSTLDELLGRFADIINYFATISGIFVIGMFVYGAVTLITAGGDAEKVKKAQGIMTNALIGLVVIIIGELMIHFVLKRIGVL